MATINIEKMDCCNANQLEFFDITLSSGYSYFPHLLSVEDFNECECQLIYSEGLDISELLMADRDFTKSIEKAREQMRKGISYLSHKEVFGG